MHRCWHFSAPRVAAHSLCQDGMKTQIPAPQRSSARQGKQSHGVAHNYDTYFCSKSMRGGGGGRVAPVDHKKKKRVAEEWMWRSEWRLPPHKETQWSRSVTRLQRTCARE